jgi:hypothetical protein
VNAAAASYGELIHDVLMREYGSHRHAAKVLARDAGTTPRTAQNWLDGTNAPNGDKLINLMGQCEALTAEIHRLIELRRASRDDK